MTQLAVQYFQAFLGHVIRDDVVDTDLHVIQSGSVQSLDPIRTKQVSIGDQTGQHSPLPDSMDQPVKIWMQQWFPATDCDYGRPKCGQPINPAKHLFSGNWGRNFVKFVAVGTREITAPHGDNVGQDWVFRREQALNDHAEFPQAAVAGPYSPF